MKIVVADDFVDAAAALAELLRDFGHEVGVANDGLSALTLIETMRPRAAVLDIDMPGLDGNALGRDRQDAPRRRDQADFLVGR